MGDRQNGNKPDGRGAVITQRKVLNMLRKTLTVVAAMAAIGAGTVGVANASTPAPVAFKTVQCNSAGLPAACTPGAGAQLLHGVGGPLAGLAGGNHGLLGGAFGLGGRDRGGRFGFGNGFGGNFGGTFWQRDGVILPYSQVVSSCGCSGSPVSFGYTEVVDPQQVLVVPEGAVVTGDGSCQSLTSVNWGLPGWNRGVRIFRGGRHF
jgi:hypothetical protein